jgi:hypothetical protein
MYYQKWMTAAVLSFAAAFAAVAVEKADTFSAPGKALNFENRSSPEAVAKLADEFLGMIVLDETEMNFTNLRFRPGLVETSKLVKEKKYAEALASFQKYFFAKLKNPASTGLSAYDVNPYERGVCGQGMWPPAALTPNPDRAKAIELADKLMQGLLILDGKELKIGEPGTVNWNHPFEKGQKIEFDKAPSAALFQASAFASLVQAYVITRKDEYLKRWAEYMDDWAINSNYADSVHPLFVSDGSNSAGTQGFIVFTRLMAALASIAPDGKEIIPPATFARIVKKYFSENLLLPVAYIRSNTHNWTPGAGLMLVSMFYDEFKVAPLFFRESRRRNIEDNAVTQNLRDGSENQQCPWYNTNYFEVNSALRLLDARKTLATYHDLPWLNEYRNNIQWKNEIREHLGERINYFIRIRTPQGEHPIPIRGGDKRTAAGIPAGDLFDMSPETYNNPVNMQIYNAMTKPDAGIRPEGYDSDWFPYGGYNIVREGWERDSGYASLFCSPQPGAYGGFRSRSNNNAFGLAAFGQDLLVDDSVGHYMYPGSPILVDGKNQFFHAGYYKVGAPAPHKVYQISAWLDPAPWRWHASGKFNLMEGVYAGPYSAPDVKTSVDGQQSPGESKDPEKTDDGKLQRDVKHQRQIQYVRSAKLWIVTDKMLTDKKHDYEQVWRFATKPCDIPAFNESDIKIDAAAKTIITRSGEKPEDPKKRTVKSDLSIYQFSTQPLDYKPKTIAKDPKNHYQVCSRLDVGVKWKGAGNQQIVTVMYPRIAYEGADLKSIKQLELPAGVNGFEAETQDGVKVSYASSMNPDVEISLGAIRIKGESLLLVQGGKEERGAGSGERAAGKEGGNLYGVALGCTQMTVNGKTVEIPCADFEFTRTSNIELPTSNIESKSKSEILLITDNRSPTTSFIPIYRPIDPVKIYPEQNVFLDQIEVKLSSGTKGVEIRYTVDGTEPNIGSTLYKAPFKLDRSAVVRAKAFRPGLKANPEYMSGTYSTPISFGVFTKSEPVESVKVVSAKPGLDCRYYEGDWKKMWLFLDDLKPLKTGISDDLFDLNIVPADNRPIGEKGAPRENFFTIEYNGFLNIPEDGVYTLHAPKEYTLPDTDPGYELNIYLGNNVVPYGGRTRIAGLNQWYPSTRLHAFGNWSIALKKGMHPFRLTYLDYRTYGPGNLNKPGVRDYIWSGVTPDLRVSGPGIDKQPIPKDWLARIEKVEKKK